ncbi:M20/M25/M40 family metallo-hydrolase [Shinella curvata]|uniref:M20/M25/M40 family metallo-hydrolase n=1 Tax=Shinella curvata TaxID=1817964 RepID=UPI00349E50B5
MTWHAQAVRFNEGLIEAVRESAAARHLPAQDIVSGAGHDTFNLARRVATTMIFIPCREGISHSPREDIEAEHAAAGTNVLFDVALKRAQRITSSGRTNP